MFLVWILNQTEEEEVVGVLARIIWKDINNGCGNTCFRSSRSWLAHFEEKHTKNYPLLKAMLAQVYEAYLASYTEQ
jgi:hypothetical protein